MFEFQLLVPTYLALAYFFFCPPVMVFWTKISWEFRSPPIVTFYESQIHEVEFFVLWGGLLILRHLLLMLPIILNLPLLRVSRHNFHILNLFCELWRGIYYVPTYEMNPKVLVSHQKGKIQIQVLKLLIFRAEHFSRSISSR